MITRIRGQQSQGKTATMVWYIRYKLETTSYRPEDVYVNFQLDIPGVNILNNIQMRHLLKNGVKENKLHKILGITEIDRMFPARFWQKEEQTEDLLGLWQDDKMFWLVYYDCHIGTSVDKVLRGVTQRSVIPRYDKSKNRIVFRLLEKMTRKKSDWEIRNVRKVIFPYYRRWELIPDGVRYKKPAGGKDDSPGGAVYPGDFPDEMFEGS